MYNDACTIRMLKNQIYELIWEKTIKLDYQILITNHV